MVADQLRRAAGSTRTHAAALGYAVAYDTVVEGFSPFEQLADVIAKRLAATLPPAARVLDVACGTGTLARRLAARGLCVHGVDAIPALPASAQRRRPPATAGRLSFGVADVARDPIPGAPFDALVSLHTLTWYPDHRAFLAGCAASVRPGAPAVFVAATRPPAIVPTLRRVLARDGAAAAVRSLRWLVPTAIFERLRDATLSYPAELELVQMLERGGFEVLECVPTFVADLSLRAWTRYRGTETAQPRQSQSSERRRQQP